MGLFDDFGSIDYSGLQTVFDSAIGSMVDSDACTVPCTLEYGVTKYDDCNNCVYDPIGRKSSNVYEAGGPVPFPFVKNQLFLPRTLKLLLFIIPKSL
jgi:hypothetical protein